MNRLLRTLFPLLVVGAGLSAAWPFRQPSPTPGAGNRVASGTEATGMVWQRGDLLRDAVPIQDDRLRASIAVAPDTRVAAPPRRAPAVVAPSGAPEPPRLSTEFESLGEPPPAPHATPPALAGDTAQRPPDRVEPARRRIIRHRTRDGDSLENLAQRYLGDAGRSREIYAANRDQLESAEWLPLGIELRIDVDAPAPVVSPSTASMPSATQPEATASHVVRGPAAGGGSGAALVPLSSRERDKLRRMRFDDGRETPSSREPPG